MFEKIIIGIVIGFISGFFITKDNNHENDSSSMTLIFIAMISIAFIGSSFMYGAIYGLLSIGEIILGFVIASSIFKKDAEE